MDTAAVLAAAEILADLRRSQRIIEDLPDELQPSCLDEAYRIQAALRIDRPLFGRLLAHTVHADGATLSAAQFVHRVVEAEFAFRIGRDVPTRPDGHTRESIAACIDAVIPSIEIVDYRYETWTIGALQVAADNAIHGCWIGGRPLDDWRQLELGTAGVRVLRNGEEVTTGSGAAVLGHPLGVMRFLADDLPRFGLGLVAGDVVTTGVTTDVFEAERGDRIVAEFEGLGTVTVAFV
jgi:2-keto-4-pentenoate hydratase